MKKMLVLKKEAFILIGIIFSFVSLNANEVMIIDENIQSWKAVSAYGSGTQEIEVNKSTGIVELVRVGIVKSRLPSPISSAGPCTEGYIQMVNSQNSMVTLPVIQEGVSKIELHIVTTADASRTVDVTVLETQETVTLTDLNKEGEKYTIYFNNAGATTIRIGNVKGGVIYVTDIKVYQNQGEVEISDNADLSSLYYKIGEQTFPIENFDFSVTEYNVELADENVELPVVYATTSHKDAVFTIKQVTELPGTATISVKASDGVTTKEYKLNFLVLLIPAKKAVLPLFARGTSGDNPLQEEDGFLAKNLGSPTTDGSAKFEGSKAVTDNKPFLILSFDSQGEKLSFDVKGNNAGSPSGFEGVEFMVEESADGKIYTLVDDLSDKITTSRQAFENYDIKKNTRYIKWTYQNATKGNITLNNVIITKSDTATSNDYEIEFLPYISHGILFLYARGDEKVEIFNLFGQLLYSYSTVEGINRFPVSGHAQFLLVKTGDQLFKVVL